MRDRHENRGMGGFSSRSATPAPAWVAEAVQPHRMARVQGFLNDLRPRLRHRWVSYWLGFVGGFAAAWAIWS